MDVMLYWWLDVIENSGQYQIEKVCCDWYKMFFIEEIEKIRQFDIRLVIINCVVDQIGNNFCQYVYVDFWVNCYYCFGYDEVIYGFCQCCCVCVIFRLIGGYVDSEN